jgi:NHL repeat-containing protein
MSAIRLLIMIMVVASMVGCKKYTNDYSLPKATPEKKWNVYTIAGSGDPIFGDGTIVTASFRAPLDIVVNDNGLIYVADALNHRIRKIDGERVTVLAGDAAADTISGNNSSARFLIPSYLSLDNNGDLLVLDVNDPRVRKISPDGFVSTIAGNGTSGFSDGRANTAEFGKECAGIAVDELGNIYVSDWRNRRIRKITAGGIVSTYAGNGESGLINGPAATAQFLNAGGLVIDKEGNLFVGDFNRIRKISRDGMVSTFVGRDSSGYKDGPGDTALFTTIVDLAIDDAGNIYASDQNRIRKITPEGKVTTIAGGVGGYKDGDGANAQFNGPTGLAVDKYGNVYVADDHNNRIREIIAQ